MLQYSKIKGLFTIQIFLTLSLSVCAMLLVSCGDTDTTLIENEKQPIDAAAPIDEVVPMSPIIGGVFDLLFRNDLSAYALEKRSGWTGGEVVFKYPSHLNTDANVGWDQSIGGSFAFLNEALDIKGIALTVVYDKNTNQFSVTNP